MSDNVGNLILSNEIYNDNNFDVFTQKCQYHQYVDQLFLFP